MVAPLKNVTIVGGTGNIGPSVTQGLLDAGFNVTALQQESSNKPYPAGVKVKKVNFESPDSLVSALQGQDAVVSTMPERFQMPVIDAAIKAQVKRFIPSEYGLDTRTIQADDPQGLGPINQGKIMARQYLVQKAAENPGFSWTGIMTGPFFDWGLNWGSLGIDRKTKTISIVDSGNESFPASNLSQVGRAVAAVLSHPDTTANQFLQVASFNTTQNELHRIIERVSGEKWNVVKVNSEDMRANGLDALRKGDFFGAFIPLLITHWVADGAGRKMTPEKGAMATLGLSEEKPEDAIKSWLTS